MATMTTAFQSAAAYLAGQGSGAFPLKSFQAAPVNVAGAPVMALCSYGDHFPVLVRTAGDTIFCNDSDYAGADYQDAYKAAGWGVNARFASPARFASSTTARHTRAARLALDSFGYVATGQTLEVAGYTLKGYSKR